MSIDPRTPFSMTPDARAAGRVADLERRVAVLERGYSFLGAFAVGANALTFSDIPQNFRHLRVIFTMQSARASFQNTGAVAYINNQSSNYSYAVRYAAAPSGSATDSIGRGIARWYLGQCPAGSRANDNYVSAGEVLLPFYSATDRIHTYQVKSGGDDGTNVLWVEGAGAYYGDTNPITRIDIRDDVSGNLGPRAKAELWAAP